MAVESYRILGTTLWHAGAVGRGGSGSCVMRCRCLGLERTRRRRWAWVLASAGKRAESEQQLRELERVAQKPTCRRWRSRLSMSAWGTWIARWIGLSVRTTNGGLAGLLQGESDARFAAAQPPLPGVAQKHAACMLSWSAGAPARRVRSPHCRRVGPRMCSASQSSIPAPASARLPCETPGGQAGHQGRRRASDADHLAAVTSPRSCSARPM